MNLFLSIGVILNLSLIIGQLNADEEFFPLTADNINGSHVGNEDASVSPRIVERNEDFWTIISDVGTQSAHDIKVLAGGKFHRNITKKALHAFNLTEETVRTAVALHFGEYPAQQLYFNDATEWGNMFQKFGTESSRFNLRFSRINLSNVTYHDEIIHSEKLDNFSDRPVKYSLNGTYDVKNTLSITWSDTHGIDIEKPMKMNIVIVRALTNFDFDYPWGVNVTKSKLITNTASTVPEIELQPHESVTFAIKARRGVMKAEFVYAADLSGKVLANYPNKHADHYFWFVNLAHILQFNDTKNCEKIGLTVEDCKTMKKSVKKTVHITQTVEISFSTDNSVIVSSP